MNKSYKSVWNETTGTYVAASETARSRGKSSRNQKVLAAALLAAGVGFGTAVKSEAAATPNSYAVGILGTNPSNSDCISSADGAQVVTNGDCSASSQRAGIVSYDSSGNAGAYFTVIDPKTAYIGAGGVDQIKITDSGVFVLNALNMGGKKITNVAAGDVSASSTDAVNGSQLYTTNTNVKALQTTTGNFGLGFTAIAIGAQSSGSAGSGSGLSFVTPASAGTGLDSIAFGGGSMASGNNSTALGSGTLSVTQALAVGSNAVAGAIGSTSVGYAAGFRGIGTYSSSLGWMAQAAGNSAVALGSSASAAANNSVALGNNTLADRINTVAVGGRQVVSVAAGTQGTDAVNYAQLQAAGLKVDSSGGATNAFVAYDDTSKATATLGGASGTTLTNLKAGTLSASSTDAVNGSELYGLAASDAAALGGGSSVTASGAITAPSYVVGGTTVNNVGAALTNLDGRTTTNATNIGSLQTTVNGLSAKNSRIAFGTNSTINLNGHSPTDAAMTAGQDSVAYGGGTYAAGAGTAVGTLAQAAGSYSTALGYQSNASATIAMALGNNSAATAQGAIAVGTSSSASATGAAALGYLSAASQTNALALGNRASASASNSVALGAGSTTTANLAAAGYNPGAAALSGTASATNGEVSIGSAGAERRITNVAAGAAATDGVNVGQLQSEAAKSNAIGSTIAAALGGGAAYDSTAGAIAAPTYNVAGGTQGDVGSALTALNNATVQFNGPGGAANVNGQKIVNVAEGSLSASSTDAVNGSQLYATNQSVAQNTSDIATNASDIAQNTSDIAKNAGDITNIDSRVTNVEGSVSTITNQINNGELGLVQQDQVSRNLTVGAATDGVQISMAGTAGNRVVTGVAAGEVSASSVDAVNGSQLYATNQSVAQNTSDIATNAGNIAQNTSDIAQNTSDISTINSQIASLGDGVSGAVAYDSSAHDKVTLAGTSGTTLTNVAAGDVSASSMDAVNGSQLYTTNQNVAQNTSDIAQNTSDIAKNAGDITNIDSRVTNVEGSVSTITNQINNGELGLVQQDQVSRNLTVGAATDGVQISMAGTAGNRVVTGVAAGEVSASSVDAVNGSQLYATNQSVAQNTSDIATNAGNIAQNTSDIAKNAGDITNIDSRVTNVESSVTDLTNQINNGELGLVQQDQVSRNLTVGAATDGVQISMAGTAGNRVVTGVAAGEVSASSVDAVNGSQLYATNQSVAQNTSDIATNAGNIAQNTSDIAQNTSDISTINSQIASLGDGVSGAVAYDSSAHDKVTLAGTSGTTLTNVAAGDVSASSMDAVNGSQLYTTNQNVAQNTSDIAQNTSDIAKNAGDITNIDSRVTNVEGSVSTITNQINNGELGLVQQDQVSRNLTVGASTDGVQISMAGTAGNRVVTGVAAGEVSASSVDAVNGSQLYATNQSVAQNTSDIATNAGNISQNTSDIATNAGNIAQNTSDIAQNTSDIAKNAGDITNIDSRVTNVEGSVSTITNQINNGELGLVQQDQVSRNLTVGASTDGVQISMAGTAGNRVVTGVAAGEVSASSVDAVNGSQLYATNQSVAQNTSDIATNAGNIAQNTSDIAQNTSDISTINSQIASLGDGVSGAVAYDSSAHDKVTLAGTSGTTLTNVAAGDVSASSMDAVNGSQLYATNQSVAQNTSDIATNAGNIAQNTSDIATNASDIAQNTSDIAKNAGDITNIDSRVTNVEGSVSTITNQINNGELGLVQQDQVSRNLTVGASTDGVQISMAGTAGNRVVTGVAAGEVSASSVDAVNGSQLYATNQSVAQNTSDIATNAGNIAQNTSDIATNASDIAQNTSDIAQNTSDIAKNAGDITNIDSRVTNVEGSVSTITNQINNGELGLVQQDQVSRNLTVGASTDGVQISMAGTAGNRVVTGVAAGEVSASSVDAVNGSQLYATNQSVAQNTSDIATNAGNIAQNTSDIAQNTGDIAKNASDIATNAGDIAKNTSDIAQNTSDIAQNTSDIAQNTTNITNLDTRVTNVEGSVTDLTNQINSGVVGLVQQDQTTGAVTVASSTGGLSVDFTGTAGARELLGVAAGTTNTSAVNLGQLSPVVSSLGGGAQVNADGSVTGPTYHVQGGTQTTVGGALDTLDTGLTSLQTQISNGSIGIVTQDVTSRDLLVGGATDGVRVNMAGTAGNRVVTGVAAGAVGAASVDAVNGSQLYANAASTAAALGGGSSVNADGTVSAPSYSVGGTTVNNVGAAITNIDGRVSQNTSDIASLQSTVGTMSGSVANAVSYDSSAHNQVTLGGSTGAPAVKLTNLQDGELSATSTDAVTGAQLWNTNQQLSDLTQSVQNQQQTGNSSMSINTGGQPAAAATGNNAIAIGGGSQASGDNSVAIGAGSVADQANTVSVGSQGNERRITNVANGIAPTDAVNVGQMQSAIGQTARAAYSGVAAATALTMIPEVDPGKTLAIGVAGGSYKGYQAAAVGASARITQNLKVKIGAGISGSETTVGAGASYQW